MTSDTHVNDSRKWRLAAILLCALFVLLYILFLGARPLFTPDEVRYGEIPREMIATGNWIVPRLNGLLYFEKPPFGHWLNAISLLVFGETAFAVRITSALSAGGSALLVFFVGRHFFASRTVPYLATFIFLTTFEVQGVGTFSVLDSMFAFFLNAGIVAFAFTVSVTGKRQYAYLAGAGALFGIAFLTKGLLAFVLPVLALVPWLFINRQFSLLFRKSWLAVVVAVLIVAPWGIAIHLQQPDFWHYFFWVEHVQRFAAENAQHKEPAYYFLVYLPVFAFPWIFLLPGAIRGLRSRDSSTDRQGAVLLLASWALLPFLFFSVASGKLLTYLLPCFVPLALLIAVGINELLTDLKAHRIAIPFIGAALVLFLAAVTFVYVQPPEEPVFLDGDFMNYALLAGALCLSLSIIVYSFATADPMRRLLGVGLSMVPILLALPPSLPASVMYSKAPVEFFTSEYGDLPADTVVVTDGSVLRAASWSLKRDDVLVVDGYGETAYGLEAPDAEGRFLTTEMFAELINSGAGVLLLCRKGCYPETVDSLPASTVNASYGVYSGHYVAPTAATPRVE